jgi:hypothetical protein
MTHVVRATNRINSLRDALIAFLVTKYHVNGIPQWHFPESRSLPHWWVPRLGVGRSRSFLSPLKLFKLAPVSLESQRN